MQLWPDIRSGNKQRAEHADEIKRAESRAVEHYSHCAAKNERNAEVTRLQKQKQYHARVRAEPRKHPYLVDILFYKVKMLCKGDDKRRFYKLRRLYRHEFEVDPASVLADGDAEFQRIRKYANRKHRARDPQLSKHHLIVDHRDDDHCDNADDRRADLHDEKTRAVFEIVPAAEEHEAAHA